MTMVDKDMVEERIITPFKPRLITGGKEPPETDWLSKLNIYSVFLARVKVSQLKDGTRQEAGPTLSEFHIMDRVGTATKLKVINSQGSMIDWIDPVSFCKNMDLFQILYEAEEETTDGDGAV